MLAYLLMLAAPGVPAIVAIRRGGLLLAIIAILYWFMIGWRFQIGADWNSYVGIVSRARFQDLLTVATRTEPAFYLTIWIGHQLGAGVIFVNAVSALVFCWGLFKFSQRCPEPFLALVYAMPSVAVVVAMSGTRQAMALGIIFYLFASWDRRGTTGRVFLLLIATMFHFSALFNAVFIALASNLGRTTRVIGVILISSVMAGIVYFFPTRFDFYSSTYIGEEAATAPGALAHIAILAVPAVFFLITKRQWTRAFGETKLITNLALASLAMVPAALVSSIAAYRFSLYFWPGAMFVVSATPFLIRDRGLAFLYRVGVVGASMAILLGWLYFSNHRDHYLPYRNWLWTPEWMPLAR